MKRTSFSLLALTLTGISAAQISFPDFSSTAGLTLNGDAAQVGNAIRLAPLGNGNAGTVFANEKQQVLGGFRCMFSARNFDGRGADGIAFVIQNDAPTAIGTGGGSNAVEDLPNSVGIQFRTFWQDAYLYVTDEFGGSTRIAEISGFDYARGDAGWEGVIDYDGGTKDWTIQYNGATIFTGNYDLGNSFSGDAYVGFGSGTGAADDNNDLRSWSYTPVPEPATLGALGLGLVALFRRRSR